MSTPPPPPDPRIPPTQPTQPLRPGAPLVRERVVEPAVDPNLLWAQMDDRIRSLRNAVVMLGLVALAALAVGIYALLRADEADRTDRDGTSRARVENLDRRVEELRQDLEQRTQGAAGEGEVDAVEERLRGKADAADVTALQEAVDELREQQADPAGPDQETADAINGLSTRVDELDQRVQELEQQQQP